MMAGSGTNHVSLHIVVSHLVDGPIFEDSQRACHLTTAVTPAYDFHVKAIDPAPLDWGWLEHFRFRCS